MNKKWLAEVVATYLLVFMGTGSIVVNALTGQVTHLGISIIFGFIVMVLIYSFGHISGAHINPAVTIAFLLRREIDWKTGLAYIVSQICGAILASLTIYFLLGTHSSLGATLPMGSIEQSFILEVILTFSLVLVILGSSIHGKAIKSFAGIAIGGMVGIEALFGGPISGASMNPARSLGPALVSGNLSSLWIYIIAPIIGAMIAVMIYSILHEKQSEKSLSIKVSKFK